jgi:MFS family permease
MYEAVILPFVLPAAVLLTINADIGPSTQINWAATAWPLGQAVVMTIAGSLSDICGRRNFALAGNLLGLLGIATKYTFTSRPFLTRDRLHHWVEVGHSASRIFYATDI